MCFSICGSLWEQWREDDRMLDRLSIRTGRSRTTRVRARAMGAGAAACPPGQSVAHHGGRLAALDQPLTGVAQRNRNHYRRLVAASVALERFVSWSVRQQNACLPLPLLFRHESSARLGHPALLMFRCARKVCKTVSLGVLPADAPGAGPASRRFRPGLRYPAPARAQRHRRGRPR